MWFGEKYALNGSALLMRTTPERFPKPFRCIKITKSIGSRKKNNAVNIYDYYDNILLAHSMDH